MGVDASYSNYTITPSRKRQSTGDLIRLFGPDMFTLVCSLMIGAALLFMPWLTTTGGGAGLKYLFEGIWSVSTKGVPVILLIPIAAIAGVLATAWRLLDFKAGKKPQIVMLAAGIGGLVYYAVMLNQFTVNEMALEKTVVYGFWVGLAGCIGLIVQVIIPRTDYQISLHTREAIIAFLFLAPFLTFFSIFVVRAVVTAFQMSFYDWVVLKPVKPWVGLDNYKELFSDYVWWDSLKNTIQFVVMTVAGTTIVALLAAVAVTQPIKGAGCFRVLLYMPQLLSVGVVGLTWVWLLNTQFGIINYGLSFFGLRPINWLGDPALVIPAISLTTIWWGFGFPMLIFIAGLQGIPDHLYEAARIDGANGRQIFTNITIPLLRPTILFVVVTGVIAHFQVFGQILIISNGGPGRSSWTVIFYLFQNAWGQAFRLGYGAAIAISLAVIMGAFTAVQFFVVGRQQIEY